MDARMVKDMLGEHAIGHISRDSTAIEARESLDKKDNAYKAKVKRKPEASVYDSRAALPL
ncbi:MAG: hypothetical protein Q7U58_13695 [Hydrogenophaga sp.]|nr:hypothetical protein [Hydrogenophaga sp.]